MRARSRSTCCFIGRTLASVRGRLASRIPRPGRGAPTSPRLVSPARADWAGSDLRDAVALPAAVVPALRRLLDALRALLPQRPRGPERGPRHARALPRLADAAAPAHDASLVPVSGVRPEPVRARGAARGGGDTPATRLIGMAQAPALPRGFELPLEPRLPRIGSIDQVAVEARAGELAKRSIKRDAKLFALELAIRCMDLTTLEGADTPGKVAALCSKAVRPDPTDAHIPSVAAVCVYPNLVPTAVERLRGTGVKVASVATAFPSGQSPLEAKLEEVRWVVANGADEVDMVIDRGAFLSGRYAKVYDEIVRVKEACGDAHLKVILETGELGTYDNVRRASLLAMAAGGDFIKTSTGKLPSAATLPVALVMLEAIRDVHDETGRMVGFKPAGGIRVSKQAVQHLVLVHETLGPEWLTPDLYRLGASSLLNDVLMQIRKERTGRYSSPDEFTVD